METLNSDLALTAYLGGGGSEMHAASAAIAEKNQIPYCGIAFALYQIHQQGYQYLFSPFPKSPQQAKDVFEALNSLVGAGEKPKIAIFTYNDDWGKEMGALWQENAKTNGYEVVVYAARIHQSPMIGPTRSKRPRQQGQKCFLLCQFSRMAVPCSDHGRTWRARNSPW